MRKNEAMVEVVRLWEEWPGSTSPPDPLKGMKFYSWLDTNHPDVLSFSANGVDKLQIISGWLNRHKLK